MTRTFNPGLRRRVAIAVLAGIALGWAAFLVTSMSGPLVYLGPIGRVETIRDPGFDPWTGRPHGDTYLLDRSSRGVTGPAVLVTDPVPEELADRWAIPLPIGIPLSGLVVFVGLTYRARAFATSEA
jgi:hypothetical protein